jgi:hypothetical protein
MPPSVKLPILLQKSRKWNSWSLFKSYIELCARRTVFEQALAVFRAKGAAKLRFLR